MALLAGSLITLGGVPLQVNDDGFTIGGVQIIDVGETWLARSRQTALRNANDGIGFDMVNAFGRRIRISYESTDAVPVNNDSSLDAMYKRVLRRNISISGSTLEASDISSLYTDYLAHQTYWAKRAMYLAQLSDDDITLAKHSSLVSQLAALPKNMISLSSPFLNASVMFAEGDSFKASAYAINIATSFDFGLVLDVEV